MEPEWKLNGNLRYAIEKVKGERWAERCRSPAADRATAESEARRQVKRLVLRSERGDGRFGSLGASVRDGFPDKWHEFDWQ